MQGCTVLALALFAALLAAPRAQAVLLFDGGASDGTGGAIEVTIRVLANDFQLAERSTITSVEVWAQAGPAWDGTLEYFFFEPAGNVPAAAPLATGLGTNVTTSPGSVAGELIYRFDLTTPVVLEAGQQYWFGLHMKQSYADDGNNSFWSTTSLDFGDTSRSAEGGNFAAWTIPPDDEAFRLHGEVPEPAAPLLALTGALVLLAARRRRGAPAPARASRLAILALAALASSPAGAAPKRYFVTVDAFPADQALDACGKGYHMAALWEILDVTQLRYDTKRGQTRADSGAGPPAAVRGWIRTGGVSGGADQIGVANCNAWTSSVEGNHGTLVELKALWADPALAVGPWEARTTTCDATHPVWCRQN